MLRRMRIGIVIAAAAANTACDGARSTSPVSSAAPQGPASADKQGSTGSEMLLVYAPPASDIYRMSDDGTNLVQLTTDFGTELDPAWAPDGKRVLYGARNFENGSWSIFVMNADGSGVTQLTHPPTGTDDGEAVTLGKGIVFLRIVGTSQGIYRMNADGSGITQLTSGYDDRSPAPSPKATSVAFVRNDDIYILDLVSGGVTNITNTPGCNESNPAYSPSGKQIAFERAACSSSPGGIFLMNEAGGQITRLTTDEIIDGTTPVWSPDGKRIGFTVDAPTYTTIYTMLTDGTAITQVLGPIPDHPAVLSAWARY